MKIRNYAYFMLTLLLASLFAAGCTQNNGRIGEWFGEWKLMSVEINGVDDESYDGNVLWKFQNNIVEMIVVDGHAHTEHYGTWSADDNTLTLNYTHSDDLTPAGTGKYAPPASTYLPAAIVQLKIVTLSSSQLILQYTPDDTTTIVYTLRKRG